jgi:thiol:disulfide interchange protein
VAATPCTAPFMGAALGFALTQPAFEALLVLLALGVGFALPMTALSMSAVLARALPRPGPWMETVKQLLAFPLYATAAWLVWVLSVQTGDSGVLAAGVVLVGAAFAAWLFAHLSGAGLAWRGLSLGVLVATFIAAYPLLETESPAAGARTAQPDDISETFSAARLSQLRAEGRPVFINFTAAWCITCKVNERVALASDRFREALKAGNIAYLKGDWTRQDPEITAMLDQFGHAGVPLYVLYPAGGAQPKILPQILTEAMVLERLDGASRASSSTSSQAL